MPYINIVWGGVDPPISPPWRLSWDSHLKERLKRYNKDFKRIKMSFCPDGNSKIKFDFRSLRCYVVKDECFKCDFDDLHVGHFFRDSTPPTISLDDLEHELRERDEDQCHCTNESIGFTSFPTQWRYQDNEYTQSDNQWY